MERLEGIVEAVASRRQARGETKQKRYRRRPESFSLRAAIAFRHQPHR
jgi:hypothetical protein